MYPCTDKRMMKSNPLNIIIFIFTLLKLLLTPCDTVLFLVVVVFCVPDRGFVPAFTRRVL